MKDFSTLFAFAIGLIILGSFEYKLVDSATGDGSYDYVAVSDKFSLFMIDLLGYLQGVTSFMLLVGFFMNEVSLIVSRGWREKVVLNNYLRPNDVEFLKLLQEDMSGIIKIEKLSVSEARLILAMRGPESPIFTRITIDDEDGSITAVRDFGFRAVKIEYYWVSLTFVISNGVFLFTNLYFIFSMQGLFQSPVFYSVHLLDVI